MEKNNFNLLALVAIVAIVAVISLVLMVQGGSAPVVDDSVLVVDTDGNIVGEASGLGPCFDSNTGLWNQDCVDVMVVLPDIQRGGLVYK